MNDTHTQVKDHWVQRQPLLFEKSNPGQQAAWLGEDDTPAIQAAAALPSELVADSPCNLPELAEPQIVRHYTNLAHALFSVDANFYPLGSCTMKYNPKVNDWAASLPGMAGIHPYQDDNSVQGALQLLYELRCFLAEIAGLDEACLQPAAGAHGELASLMVINAFHQDNGDTERTRVLVPDSAHGTNPASCSLCGRYTDVVRSTEQGLVDVEDLKAKVDERVAAMMITNPNTVGRFDTNIDQIAQVLHDAGAKLYVDGANMNAILGMARPGDFGADIMHFNVHKTFSTPHGCGGPGAGPIACTAELAPYLPRPQIVRDGETYRLDYDRPKSVGRVRAFTGQFGVLVRAYTYIRALGPGGLRDVSETAVLNANYLAARLRNHYDLPMPLPCMHEFVISADRQKQRGVRALDIAKRLIDYGFHPPTMYWPDIVSECIMIEPTETESLATLDSFVDSMIEIANDVISHPDRVHEAPHTTPVGRVDEVTAARQPDLRWSADNGQ